MIKLNNLTKEELTNLYTDKKKSLEDIAKLYKVSRVAVYKKLKKFGITQRSKSEARIEAQKQGKIPQKFFDINENFFSNWSPEMAYVLGLIITDGCISNTGRISLNINDRELLEKVKKVLGSEHKIEPSKHQKNLYIFHFARENMVKRLGVLGVIPKKSLVVKFPDVPEDYLPDFVRGIFDGDGCIYLNKHSLKLPLRTKFISGSESFIIGLKNSLEHLGLPERTIYRQKTKNGYSYTIVFGHKDSEKLFEILYKNTQNRLFLERKYGRFLEGLREAQDG